MAERLGIITRYLQHEVTHAAIHLAEMARDQGTPSTIYGVDPVRREVAKQWDSRVITQKQQHLDRWAQRCNRIIWTHVPEQAEVLRIQGMGIETVLLINWEALVPQHGMTALTFNRIILPYRCVANVLQRRWDLSKVQPVMMPWDVPVPHTRRAPGNLSRDLCVYFPLYDTLPARCDQAIFAMMRQVLAETKNTNVLVSCGRRWSLSSRRLVKRLRKVFGERIVLVLHPNILHRLLLFARADLTVWAPRFESFGLVGLNSLCMGAPVISWDVRPQNEFLKSWKNSVLVPAKTEENWLGVPDVKSGYQEFSEMLISTLRDRALIAKMKGSTLQGLDARRKQFEAGWQELQH